MNNVVIQGTLMNNVVIQGKDGKESKELVTQPVDNRRFGNVSYAVFNHRNKKNKLYRTIVFSNSFVVNGAWQSRKWGINPSQLSDLQACIDAARKWLRDK